MTTTIAPLTQADRRDWAPLWAGYLTFYEHELSEEQTDLTFARILDPDYPMFGAIARDETGRAIGIVHWLTHASTWSDAPYTYLEDLFVAPDVRRSGAGRALIDHVLEWTRNQGLPKVYWQTARDNATARSLYDTIASNDFVVYEVELT